MPRREVTPASQVAGIEFAKIPASAGFFMGSEPLSAGWRGNTTPF